MLTLSKARFAAGLQCLKRLYLELHAPELRAPDDAGREALARNGIEVGVLARQRFAGGTLVEHAASWDEAVAVTGRLVGDETVPVIYEGAFEHAGARVRADVLRRVAPGTFELIEVKAGSRVREHHETDLAFQVAVITSAGHEVARARLMLLDREYVHAGGPPDLARLFTLIDLTDKVRALVPEVLRRLVTMQPALTATRTPAIANGPQCLVPFRCPYFAHCHGGGPDHPVTDLPRLKADQLVALAAIGVDDIRGIPDDFPGLTPLQRRAWEAVKAGGAVRDPAVVDLLAAIPLPAHFVDFETFAPAVPVYPGTRPFEQVPFQWSDHVLAADGTLTHHEFLHDDDSDPRAAFATSFLAATGGAAALIVYSSFEADVLAALANQLPQRATALLERRKRIVDLLPLVRDHCYHPALRGSFSIKTVLPAFVPELGYDDLAIRDGLTASLSHATLIDPRLDPARRRELRAQLLAYCARDTEAMVALYRVLGQPIARPAVVTERRSISAVAGRGDWPWIVAATLVSLTLAGSILFAGDGGREATRLALRATARLSLVYFILAFVASPLARLRPGTFSRWLVRRRRAFGIAFGASMTVHVGCILRLYTLYAPDRPPMVTDADFFIGVPGLVVVALMSVTSLLAVRRRLAPAHWRRLHRIGIYVVWSIFFLCLIDSVGRKETAHPVLGYYLFVAVLVSAMALRLAAWRASAPVRGTRAMEDAR